MSRKAIISSILIISLSSIAFAADTNSTTSTYGDKSASQTSSLPVYQTKGGTSVNLQSTTTVTGGYQTSGSGNIVPSTNPGSQSSTSYGVGVTIPMPGGNK